jgi:hypothetical protein
MSKEKDLLKALQDATAAYHEASETATQRKLAALNDNVIAARAALNTFMSEGAKDCPVDGARPITMRRGNGTYETGCPACSRRSNGDTREEAIENWNEDKLFVKAE